MDPNGYFESHEYLFKRKSSNYIKKSKSNQSKKKDFKDDLIDSLLIENYFESDEEKEEEEKEEEIPEKDVKEIIKWRKFKDLIKMCSEKRKDLPSIEFNSPIITKSHVSPNPKEDEYKIKDLDFKRDLSSFEEKSEKKN